MVFPKKYIRVLLLALLTLPFESTVFALEEDDICSVNNNTSSCAIGLTCINRSGTYRCAVCYNSSYTLSNPSVNNNCYKSCSDKPIANGNKADSDELAYYPDGCNYELTCNAGHYISSPITNTDTGAGGACAACPVGSYQTSDNTEEECTLCTGGTINTGNGNTASSSCAANCPNRDNVATWKTSNWNDGAPTTCVINSCNSGYKLESGSCVVEYYTITYQDGSDTLAGLSPAEYNVEQLPVTLPTPTKAGSTFVGWYNNSVFTGTAIITIAIGQTGNKTFYPKWTDCSNAQNVEEWDSGNCVIKKCKVGYYINADNCTGCTSGKYCSDGKTQTACSKGWYCPGGFPNKPNDCSTPTAFDSGIYIGRCACPAGKTTTDTGKTLLSDCNYAAGTGGTKFCDKGNNCFYLP